MCRYLRIYSKENRLSRFIFRGSDSTILLCAYFLSRNMFHMNLLQHMYIYMYDSYYEQVFDQVCSHQGLLFIYQKHHSNYEVTFYIILRLHFINISLQSYIWISKIMFDWNLRKLIGILTYNLFGGKSADYIYY